MKKEIETMHLISVRLTKDEKKRLQHEAHSFYLSVSTYIRFKLFNLI